MATTVEQMTELAMKLQLSKLAVEKLSQRATKTGQDVSAVASGLIEQAVTQPNFEAAIPASSENGDSAAGTGSERIDIAEEGLEYSSVPARRSYSVEVAVAHRGRGIPAPFDLDPE
jgi:hypothetical protein